MGIPPHGRGYRIPSAHWSEYQGDTTARAGEPYLHLWSAFVPIRMGSPRNLVGKFSLGGRL